MTSDPRQQIADVLTRVLADIHADEPWQWEGKALAAVDDLAALGYVVVHCPEGDARLVRHEDGTITSHPVEHHGTTWRLPSGAWDSPVPQPWPNKPHPKDVRLWREVPDEQ